VQHVASSRIAHASVASLTREPVSIRLIATRKIYIPSLESISYRCFRHGRALALCRGMRIILFLSVALVLWALLSFIMQPIRTMSESARHAAGVASEITR